MKDYVVLGAVILGFASLITVHVYIAARLLLRDRPRWRGLVAFVIPPLAPIWGYRHGLRVAPTLWLVAVLVYVVAAILGAK